MNTNATALILADNSGVSAMPPPEDPRNEKARELFLRFRGTFLAEKLQERVVFWRDQQSGNRSVLRYVPDLSRKRKVDDKLIGTVQNNLCAEPILVGNFAAGCNMTAVRWEIYEDFELTKLGCDGRFDQTDLCAFVTAETTREHQRQGIIPKGDWDFDNLDLFHRCPLCNGMYDRESVIYLPQKNCETCGKCLDLSTERRIIVQLLGKQIDTDDRIITLPVQDDGKFHVQRFLDPVANSIAYWWLKNFSAIGDLQSAAFTEVQMATARNLYQNSILQLLTVGAARDAFLAYLNSIIPDDWELFLVQATRAARLLEDINSCKSDRHSDWARTYMLGILPSFINAVILRQPTGQLPALLKEKTT